MESKQQHQKKPVSIKKQVVVFLGVAVVVLLIGTGLYKVLANIKGKQLYIEDSQEQFVGVVQVSEQLQDECQRSAEKIAKYSQSADSESMLTEYLQHAENCRDVFVSLDKNFEVRNEGNYPDLIIDIAFIKSKTDKSRALEILNNSQKLGAWEFYMGPITCNSKTVIDAYSEAINSSGEKECLNVSSEKDRLVTELKNKNFEYLTKTLALDGIVYVGSLESDSACPQKVSSAIKMLQNATSGGVSLEEDSGTSTEVGRLRLSFKTKDEDRAVLVFSTTDNCLRLQSVLIPEQQTNE